MSAPDAAKRVSHDAPLDLVPVPGELHERPSLLLNHGLAAVRPPLDADHGVPERRERRRVRVREREARRLVQVGAVARARRVELVQERVVDDAGDARRSGSGGMWKCDRDGRTDPMTGSCL